MANSGDSGGALKNPKVLIAIALAVAALIAAILLMRGQGDEAANMSGPDTTATQAAGMNVGEEQAATGDAMTAATPGYGQPNNAPTENLEQAPGETLPVDPAATPGPATPPQG